MNPQALMKPGCARICSLWWADVLVAYALFVMQNYLTDVWNISITNAAGIINIWNGISKILPVFFLFLVDAFIGHFMMLVISSVAYSVGISFVAMSTPPVNLGPCDEYEQKCIGETQKVIFYIGMALTAAGMAGHLVSLHRFLGQQTETTENAEESAPTTYCLKLLGFLAVVLIPIIAAIALPYIKPWGIRFGIPAICTTVSTLLFFTAWGVYVKGQPEPKGSPITNVFRVFWAFLCKYTENNPDDEESFYKKEEQESFTHTRFLRRLEKAAIILPGDIEGDQVTNRWKLCAVSEVEEAKIAVRMVPMWLTFIVCGMVSSIGDTYFIEQANHMNRKIGAWNVPLPALLLLYEGAKYILGKIADMCLPVRSKVPENAKAPSRNKYLPSIGIVIAMVFSILCCITAAKIEIKRLRVIIKHGLLEKPDAAIPMSVYWLLFQFFLLAGLNAFIEKSVAAFYTYQGPDSMKYYLDHFTRGVFGLGFMFNVLSVHAVGKISERGGKKNWFQFTLNKSRLDRYYWFLAALSSVNLVVFIMVACCYRYKNIERPKEECEANGEGVAQQPPEGKNEEEKGGEGEGEGEGEP